ncbi:rod shape-determining protein MreC [Hydrogenivirga caldilitoris]|uniref:Cell shape-determining protein MreC n=1 Tax=Hydrogenivirga caldilitoris TaxID=246264 RepID=A0A497XS47_9AQUI|nr:rod shape-determining protein MreC [Hydrogenivirga caldilitoris]RLJ71081.1 rod shape-determining protein MreC [Hydrogenivirga caldilitoris]
MTGKRFHLLSILVVLLGLLLFFSELSRFSYVRAFVKVTNMLISPVIEFKEQTTAELKEELSAYLYFVEAEKENIKLRRRLNSLLLTEKELDACLSELESVSRKLRASTNFKRLNYAVSRVIYYDPSGFDLFIVIEGGEDKGYSEGDLVVTENKVVGIVETVYGSTSRVITPFNEKFSTSAVVGASPKKYIYKGGYPNGNLLHVNVEDDVAPEKDVYMVDIKEVLPPFLIGKVVKVERGRDPFFKEVKVKPEIDPRAEEYVFVVRRKH